MPTLPVRLEFILSPNEPIVVKHTNLPVSSTRASLEADAWKRAAEDSTWLERFKNWYKNLVRLDYLEELTAKAGSNCVVCGNTRDSLHYYNVEHLHDKQDLHVLSHIYPVCGSQECEDVCTRQSRIDPNALHTDRQNRDQSRNTPASS
jgi:hypothetical protein